jgi:uncharacterized spore protein YtfJ
MIDTMSDILSVTDKRSEKLAEVLESIYAAVRPGAVYGEPVVSGNYTVITASEVSAGGGFGSGISFGPEMSPAAKRTDEQMPQSQQRSGGGGLGGGGGSSGRPIAAIIIGPDGVTVKPVVDATKIALASITAFGAMFVLLRKMLRAGGRK